MEVTIGIIVRNEEKHISQLLNSLLNLDFPKDKFEIIIVDGDSTDKTASFAKKILEKSKIQFKIIDEKKEAIKLIKNNKISKEKANIKRFELKYYGPCFARNLVIEKSNKESKYIAFIDGDCVADKNWLKNLVKAIKKSSKNIAGAGGTRLIAETKNKKELFFNSILTSKIASGGNPAFSKRKTKKINSIPNYNAIYKKEILLKNKYDNKLVLSDDIELNYRLRKNKFEFIFVPEAKVYHHETTSLREFLKNMYRYGINISRVIKKYRRPIRIYSILTTGLLISPIITLFWIFLAKKITNIKSLIYLPIIFYMIYFIFLISVYVEVSYKTKQAIKSLSVLYIIPAQHINYALGIIKGLLFDSRTRK